MKIIKYEVDQAALSTTPCSQRIDVKVGSLLCGRCDHFVGKANEQVACSAPEEKSRTKIEILKDISVSSNEQREVLNQVIEILDNPLGVLPGEEIEVWGDNPKHTFKKIYRRYQPDSFPWKTGTNEWKHARLPETNIPILTEKDVEFLKGLTSATGMWDSDISELSKILRRKS